LLVLRHLDQRPVDRVQHDARRRVLRERDLQHREADPVDALLLSDADARRHDERVGLRDHAVEVDTRGVAVHELRLFGCLQTVPSPSVDRAAQRRQVVEDLAGQLEQVRDRPDRRVLELVADVRVRLGRRRVLRNDVGVVREARLTDILDRVARRRARRDEVANRHHAERAHDDARALIRIDDRVPVRVDRRDRGTGPGDRLTRNADAYRAAERCAHALRLERLGEELAGRLLTLHGTRAPGAGDLLLDFELTRLDLLQLLHELALLHQQIVDFLARGRRELAMLPDFRLALLGERAEIVADLREGGIQLLDLFLVHFLIPSNRLDSFATCAAVSFNRAALRVLSSAAPGVPVPAARSMLDL